ncbi:MAG: hypothetical protein Q9169_003584 [Polycauliona sp. 2 TL-2023]
MLHFAALQRDSFLPGYQEVTLVFAEEHMVSYRVVPDTDPRLADLKSLAESYLPDVQRKWNDKNLANDAILPQVNALSNRSDPTTWWDSIVKHRLQAKAESEGEMVNQRFQNGSGMDRATAKRLAELINTEKMDLVTFEFTIRKPDDKGKLPTLKDIRKHRRSDQAKARDSVKIMLAQGDVNTSQAPSQAAPTKTIQPDPISISETSNIVWVVQPSGMVRPVEPRDDPDTDTRTPTPVDITCTADPTLIKPSPIVVAGPVTEAGISPGSNEKLHPLVRQNEEVLAVPSSVPVESSQAVREFAPSDSDQISSVQNGPQDDVSQPQPFTTIAQMSEMTIPDSSSPTTPTQASFDLSSASAPLQPAMNQRKLWQSIKWAYMTHTRADIELQSKGIWLFEKPTTCTPKKINDDISSLHLQTACPIAISSDFEDRSEPYLEYNDSALTMYTHHPPWANDPRSNENFAGIVPDFQSEVPLAEYQSVEALGSYVWRHDRDMLPCRGPNCKKMLSDMSTSTLICLGCGPKSIVRFCSVQCHLASLPKHVLECRNPRLLINKLIDENSAPPRFSHLAPSIRDRHGYRTYQNYRQRVAAQYAGGRYSMFNPATEEATILIWDKKFMRHHHHGHPELPYPGYATEMESRVERCLNIALFDHTNTPVIEHLYRLLQLCLQVKQAWNPALAAVLTRQFSLEFAFDASASLRIRANEPFCECEWEGGAVRLHAETCERRFRAQGEVMQGQRSVRDVVEGLENRHWVLRAWRRQFGVEKGWSRRVMGVGFPGVVVEEGWMPKLGRGWIGFNGEEDDVVS